VILDMAPDDLKVGGGVEIDGQLQAWKPFMSHHSGPRRPHVGPGLQVTHDGVGHGPSFDVGVPPAGACHPDLVQR
jgi:hypothetical protein